MTKIKNKIKKSVSIFLTLCLIFSLCSVSAFADTEMVSQENGINTEISVNPDQSSDQNIDDGMNTEGGIISDQEQSEINSEEDGDSIENTEPSEEEISEDEESVVSESLLEEETEEVDFEETGLFGIDLTDRNGVKIHPWLDTTSNIYYLFLTNAISISEMELAVTGVKIEKTSNGVLDPKTNTITGAFVSSGDGITLTAKDGKKYNIIAKQSGLPSLSISLNGVTLDQIHAGSKDIKYPGQEVLLTDASGNINVSQSDVEIKGRGNTTWVFSDKRPYQIKFSKRQAVLGMAKAKKWVLLANSFDDDMLRNTAAFYAGDAIGLPYTPDSQFVDLWIDGDYRGTYQIAEKVEIDTNRLNLTDALGGIYEVDVFYGQEEYYFYDKGMNVYYSLSDNVDESNGQAAINHFSSSLAQFENYLFNTAPGRITLQDLSRYIDVDDFIKWTLVNDYMSNCESYTTSWFWYKDGPNDVIHLGPLWDFDTSQNMGKSLNEYDLMYGMTMQKMLVALMKIPQYAARTQQIFRDYRGVFSSLSGKVYEWGNALAPAAESNYTRWKYLGKTNQKPTARAFRNTYAEAVSDHATWLAGRDSGFKIPVAPVPTAKTDTVSSESGRLLNCIAYNVTGTSSVKVAIWSDQNGQDDLKWYDLKKNADGSMSIEVDLKNHGASDTYYAHFYSGGTLLGTHTLNVEMAEIKPEINALYTEQAGLIEITLKGVSDYSSLNTAIWTETNGQDDLRWIKKEPAGNNEISFSVDAAELKGIGLTHIHVYGTVASKQSLFATTTIDITDTLKPEVTVEQTDGGCVLDITATAMAGYSSVKAAVWGEQNGQNDLKWYDMTKQADGSWTASVDFTSHKESGLFHVHVYAVKNGKNQIISAEKITTVKPAEPSVSVYTISEGEKYSALLKNASSCSSVSFAVWGEKNGQNDLKWYTGKKKTDSSWTADIPMENHNETGLIFVHVYGMVNGKNTFLASTEFTVENLSCMELDTHLSPSGKTLTASLENASGMSNVTFAVWGEKDGQNDLKWYSGKKNLDGSWTATIDLSSHKETGLYNVHVYGVKNGKNGFAASGTVQIDAFAKPLLTADDRGKTFLIKIANTDDYDKIRFAVWTEYQGQDDLKWYTAAPYSDASYRFFVKYAAHGGNGTYNIHAYGTKAGKESILGTYILNKTDLEKPAVTATLNADQTELTIEVEDSIGYSTATAAVWGSVNGQNDLKWYTLTNQGNGQFSATVNIASHTEKGLFNIHVYGKEAGKQFLMNVTSITVS